MAKMIVNPLDYQCPQINETWGETQFNDCTWAAGLGLVDIWTTGAVTRTPDWRPMNNARIKAQREGLREASGDLTGGSTLDDLARGVAAYWPTLPPLRTSTAGFGHADFTFDQLVAELQDDQSALIMGNPSKIPNQSSFLRTAQNNDDYDHSVLALKARKSDDAFLIMDPLRPFGSKPRWVPKREIKLFMSRFQTPTGIPYYAIARRGAASPLGVALHEIKDLRDQLAGRPVNCDDAVAAARAQGIADAAEAAAAVR